MILVDVAPVIVVIVPLPPNAANARPGHWRVAHKKKKAYWDALNVMLAAGMVPDPPSAPITPAYVSADLFLWNWMDDDNASHMLKPLMDWLVSAGYLANDNRKHMRWEGYPTQTIDRRWPRARIRITLDQGQ